MKPDSEANFELDPSPKFVFRAPSGRSFFWIIFSGNPASCNVEKRRQFFRFPHRVPRLVLDKGRAQHFILSTFCAPGTREPRAPRFFRIVSRKSGGNRAVGAKNAVFRFPHRVPRLVLNKLLRKGAALYFEHFLCSRHSGTSGPRFFQIVSRKSGGNRAVGDSTSKNVVFRFP